MTIATLDDWIASGKQQITLFRSGTRTTVSNVWFSIWDLAGQPGAGTLAGTSTAAGVVPTDATAGAPLINAFGGAALGYLSNITVNSTVAVRVSIYDMVFKAGAYAFNAATTLASQPSYSSRMPGGTDYSNTEIWLETVTAFTGNQSIAVTYTNQDGTAGRTTGTIATGVAPTVGRMLRLPLQAGDTGVQKIESVTSTVSTAGTFNVLVLRRLSTHRVGANGVSQQDFSVLGMPQVFDTSCIYQMVNTDSTTSSTSEVFATIASK